MHASVETIYQAIYLQARGELKQELKRAMRQGRTARRPQGGQGRKPRFREPMAMISERPPEIEDRAVPGHWEGDLITGSRNKSAIGTLVERTTRFTILLHLPDGHDAEHVQQAIIDKMQHLPKLLRNSLTWDQGAELALHTPRSRRRSASSSTSLFRTTRGSAAPTRTPTGSCASTSPKAPTYPSTRRTTSTRSPRNSTTGHAKPSGS